MMAQPVVSELWAARAQVDAARRALAGAGSLTWSSTTADLYRAALADAAEQVRVAGVALEAAAHPVAAFDLSVGTLG